MESHTVSKSVVRSGMFRRTSHSDEKKGVEARTVDERKMLKPMAKLHHLCFFSGRSNRDEGFESQGHGIRTTLNLWWPDIRGILFDLLLLDHVNRKQWSIP